MPPRYFKDCFYFSLAAILFLGIFFIFIWVHLKFLNSSWTVMKKCSWNFVFEQFMNCDYELFMNFCSWTSKVNFPWTLCELFMNYFWIHSKFLNSSWIDDELFMNVYSLHQQCELFRNYWWIVHELFLFHNKFLNSSWIVMVNCSWTLVHEPTMWVFHELFMNCSWMFMNVLEQFIKSWTTFHRGRSVI